MFRKWSHKQGIIYLQLKKRPALLKSEPGRPLLTIHRLRSLSELQSFFYTLSQNAGNSQHSTSSGHALVGPRDGSASTRVGPTHEKEQTLSRGSGTSVKDKKETSAMSNREYVEHLLETDFLESLVWLQHLFFFKELRFTANVIGQEKNYMYNNSCQNTIHS